MGGFEEKRNSVLNLHLEGERYRDYDGKDIRVLNYKTFREDGSIKRRKYTDTDSRRTATNEKTVEEVSELMRQNPCHSTNRLAKEIQISPKSAARVLKKDLNAYMLRTRSAWRR